jgi:hypothetical protein
MSLNNKNNNIYEWNNNLIEKMDSNEILVKKKDLLERLTVDIIKKKFNIEPPFKPEDIIKLESFKVSDLKSLSNWFNSSYLLEIRN